MDSSTHVTHGDILLALDGELEADDVARLTAHLEACWSCRARRDRVQAATRQVVDYRELRAQSEDPPTADGRALFLARLADSQSVHRPMWHRRFARAWAAAGTQGVMRPAEGGRRRLWQIAFAGVAVVIVLLPTGALAWVTSVVKTAVERILERDDTTRASRAERVAPALGKDVVLPALPAPSAAPIVSARPTAVAPVLGPAELALLELDVLSRLDSVGALLVGGEVEVVRAGSRIEVRGLVEDTVRRRVIVDALAPVARSAVRVNVRTLSEGLRELPPSSGLIQFRPLEFDAGGIPTASDLRAHLLKRPGRPSSASGSSDDVDGEVRRVATSALRFSRGALRHALAMESVAERYEAPALRELNPKAYEVWMRLIGTHAKAFGSELGRLRELLEPVFVGDGAGAADASGSSRSGEASPLNVLVPRLGKLAVTIDDVVREGMTTSTEKVERVQVREAEFWRIVREAERLATFLSSGR